MRILLADANPKVRAALRLVLANLDAVVETSDSPDIVRLLAEITANCPDIVLLDVDLPGAQLPRPAANPSLAELVQVLRSLCPALKIIALSSSPGAKQACLQAGVDAFFCKSDPPDELLDLLASALRGKQISRGRGVSII